MEIIIYIYLLQSTSCLAASVCLFTLIRMMEEDTEDPSRSPVDPRGDVTAVVYQKSQDQQIKSG